MYSIWVDVSRLCSGTAIFCEGRIQVSLGVGVSTALEPAPSGEWGITTLLVWGVIWSSLGLLYEFTLCIETVCFSLCDVHALCLCCQHPPVRHVLNILHPSRRHALVPSNRVPQCFSLCQPSSWHCFSDCNLWESSNGFSLCVYIAMSFFYFMFCTCGGV